MRNNKFILGLLAGFSGALLICAISLSIYVYAWNENDKKEDSSKETTQQEEIDYDSITTKVKLLEKYINMYFLNQVDDSALADGIYKGVLESLDDPYSTYYNSEEYKSLQESSSGSYCGIGAYVSQDVKSGVITIVKPFEYSPAHEAGILPGDILYKVEGKEVTGEDLTDIVSRMKGEAGTTVELSVIREGEADPLELTVTRNQVEVSTISYEMMEDKIGFIQVTEFEEVTAKQFRNAIDDLEKQGMEGLVVDLRNNPGGLLDTVVDMLDRLVKEGMLVYTKDKNGEGSEYKADDQDEFTKPLSVLINGSSASASEVFAGAVQDYGIGTLVGTTSFGKGIVQSVLPLSDGSAIKLTVSKYYTPNDRNIHGIGIEPDVEVELDEELAKKVTIEKEEDNQLQKAVEVVKDKIEQE